MTRVRHCVEALACAALLTSLVSDRFVAAIVCAVTLGVAAVVAPSKADCAATREGDGR